MSEFIDEAIQYLRIIGRSVLADEVSDLHKAAAALAVEKAELRAQVATLTAERNRLSTLWGESQAEIARVKALVADAPSAGFQYRLGGIGTWNQASQCTVDECKKFNSENPHLPQFETREVIARPNLEQKP